MNVSPRVRRLLNDHKAMQQLQAESTILSFAAAGDPPDLYEIRFRGRGLARPRDEAEYQLEHTVHVRLGAGYPRMMPELRWGSPVFHPNISGSGAVCLGGYGTFWVPSLTLPELCVMLWDMIRFQNYDIASPYNREAAMWVKEGRLAFPLDPRPLRDRVAMSAAGLAPSPPVETPNRQAAPQAPIARGSSSGPRPPHLRGGNATPNSAPGPFAAAAQAVRRASEPVEAEVVFLDEAPASRPPPSPPASSSDDGILFLG